MRPDPRAGASLPYGESGAVSAGSAAGRGVREVNGWCRGQVPPRGRGRGWCRARLRLGAGTGRAPPGRVGRCGARSRFAPEVVAEGRRAAAVTAVAHVRQRDEVRLQGELPTRPGVRWGSGGRERRGGSLLETRYLRGRRPGRGVSRSRSSVLTA